MGLKITVDKDSSIKIEGEVTLRDELLYEVFNKLPEGDRETHLIKALKLGIHGYEIDEVATFISRAEKEVDVNLSILKAIRKTQAIQEQTTQKGEFLEIGLDEALGRLIDENGWEDEIKMTGATHGALRGRKVGDLTIEVDNKKSRVAIESKNSKAVGLYDLKDDAPKNPETTATGQLLLAAINREAEISIIVFDKDNCHSSIEKLSQPITFMPNIPGFIVKIQPKVGDYTALHLAYSVARDLSLIGKGVVSSSRLNLALDRSYRDLRSVTDLESQLKKLDGSAENIKKVAQEIRQTFEKTAESFTRTIQLLQQEINGDLVEKDWVAFFNET